MNQVRYTAKRYIQGNIVYVLAIRTPNRRMKLEEFPSRVIKNGEIHELVVSADVGLRLGSEVIDVSYIGFFEVDVSGIAESGDQVWVAGCHLGTLVGFDLTHDPNHLNIVIHADVAYTGAELALELGAPVHFKSPSSDAS